LVSLAKELDIKIEYNSVDIPDTWGMEESLGMVFYRHVNGVLKAHGKRQIFDLAMDIYDSGYPQHYISEAEVVAMLMNNRAIEALDQQQIELAEHSIKLAVSYSPENPDLWVNLGVIEKRHGSLKNAERAFLYAYGLDKYSIVAVSNLERFYREQGQRAKASTFAKQAERARMTNPYIHYNKALALYKDEKYREAMRETKRAIMLHKQDPKFFELKSLIAQQQQQFRKALLALEQAYLLSTRDEQRSKYANKVDLVTRNAISATERSDRRARLERAHQNFQLQNSLLLGR
jgi:Flp pilus assembly protein TadD